MKVADVQYSDKSIPLTCQGWARTKAACHFIANPTFAIRWLCLCLLGESP
ncbi:MAG: hypothetical protein KDF64_18705, partial [Geminicoccaceae bacterium]|nr:hypothetical protein [Geminicoccaceae bacterium]